MQIDLIDSRHMPENDQKWILHVVGHWSKFHFAVLVKQAYYTLERMISARSVEAGLKSPPWTEWLPFIVRVNLILLVFICTHAIIQIDLIIHCSKLYCFITDTLNTQVHDATKHTPYELVFSQPSRSLIVLRC